MFFKKLKQKFEQIIIEKRKSQKYLRGSNKLSNYVEALHENTEDKKTLEILKKTWKEPQSFMQIPLSEAKFLELFVKATKARTVLEIGTFRGWSAVFIAKALPEGGRLITIDHDARIESGVKELWKASGVENKIEFRLGKALQCISDMKRDNETFDMVFIDADKEHCKEYLDGVMDILNPQGVVFVDNVLWAGLVASPNPAGNGAKYMKEFNDYVFKKYGASASIIPAWDGVLMIVK